MRIVFLGTPEFAVATLNALYKEGHDIAAVVTAPDKPAGRGQKMHYSEVKEFALAHHLPILQPEKLKNEDFIQSLKELGADLFIVVAFRMLPEAVFTIPPKGTFNVHASLLPDYRGAAPIHHAVMNGETKTGVTTFFLNKEIDKGDIIACREVEIGPEETTGELYERLMLEGASLAVHTIHLIEQNQCTPYSQEKLTNKLLKFAPKIEKKDTLIDWEQTAEVIHNKIRGLSPFPGAYTRIKNKEGEIFTIKCYKAKILQERSIEQPGSVTIVNTKRMTVATQNFQISLQNIQFQGKNNMKIEDFLAGFRPEKYTLFLF